MKMIPPVGAFGKVQSTAEVRVANLLSQIDFSQPATCFYSVHLTRHAYKKMSEIDFVVVLEDCVIAIEVKGGRVGRQDGVWTFTNRHNETSIKREGPFEQARSGMFSLKRRLEEAVPGLDMAWGFLVVTPDQPLSAGIEWEAWEHLGPPSMNIADFTRAIGQSRRRALDAWKPCVRPGSYKEVGKILRPDFDLIPLLSAESGRLEIEFKSVLEGQHAVLESAESNARLLCEGGAGTGKTLLAAETARRAAVRGERVVFTCLSRPVLDYVSVLLADTDVKCIPFADMSTLGEAADLVVVDEAQDVINLEGLAALELSLGDSFDATRWRLFCDSNNQAHVDGAFDREVYELLRSAASVVTLVNNCRNTAPIINQTQLITGADLGKPRVGAGPNVKLVPADSDETAAAALDERIKQVRAEDIPLDDLAIVTLRPLESQSSAELCAAWRQGKIVRAGGVRRKGSAVLYRPEEIKGLEAPHVCVIDVDDLDKPQTMQRLYVAMTRPRYSLWGAFSELVWDQIKVKFNERLSAR
jgi:hypothetical protein